MNALKDMSFLELGQKYEKELMIMADAFMPMSRTYIDTNLVFENADDHLNAIMLDMGKVNLEKRWRVDHFCFVLLAHLYMRYRKEAHETDLLARSLERRYVDQAAEITILSGRCDALEDANAQLRLEHAAEIIEKNKEIANLEKSNAGLEKQIELYENDEKTFKACIATLEDQLCDISSELNLYVEKCRVLELKLEQLEGRLAKADPTYF